VLCFFVQISRVDTSENFIYVAKNLSPRLRDTQHNPQVCLSEALQADWAGVLKIWRDLRDDNTGEAGVRKWGRARILRIFFFPSRNFS